MTFTLRMRNRELIDDLADFLRRRECFVERSGPDTLDVDVHPSLGESRAQVELDLLLRVWQTMHEGTKVQLARRS